MAKKETSFFGNSRNDVNPEKNTIGFDKFLLKENIYCP